LMFEKDRASRFGIVPRHGDNNDVRWFETPACFVWHTLNAYEDGDEVVLLGCRVNSANLFATEDVESDAESNIPRMHRWRFNMKDGSVREERLDDAASEFPRVNDNFLGQPTRYGYAGKMGQGSMSGVIKYDLHSGKSQIHQFGKARCGGEAVFVPRGSGEDEGWVMTFVYDSNEDKSELVVVDAQNMTSEPVARVLIPQRVPYGFHGDWVSEEKLQKSQ
ncbi:MAG: carotenoid oxygenase family protein, partial [Rivularia sp. (in: cyanobacteria)]